MDKYSSEEEAFAAFAALMRQARECRTLFETAGVPLPARLRIFLSDVMIADVARDVERPMTVVPPPDPPPRPTEWQERWIWVPVSDVNTSGLVRGVLRGAKNPMTPKQIMEAVRGLGKSDVNAGSVANIGTRLSEAGEIMRDDGMWSMIDRARAPVLHEGYAWGPPSAFEKQEVAAYRRMCIIHVLRAQPDGLQPIQLTRTLQHCDWLQAPCSNDLVKFDIQELQESQKIRRVGNTGKWRAV